MICSDDTLLEDEDIDFEADDYDLGNEEEEALLADDNDLEEVRSTTYLIEIKVLIARKLLL